MAAEHRFELRVCDVGGLGFWCWLGGSSLNEERHIKLKSANAVQRCHCRMQGINKRGAPDNQAAMS
eukprot:6035428-Amphidinium_carterae.1